MDRIQIMAIDDSHISREVIALLVGRDSSMDMAASAESAEEAWMALEEHDIDVITLDLQLPDTDGLALLELLAIRDTCGVVVVSGDARQHQIAISLGAIACFEKSRLIDEQNRFLAAIRRAAIGDRGPYLRMIH
jgi:DNA-binding NarL/FixJ family response regulator